jgi:hypothetical protein
MEAPIVVEVLDGHGRVQARHRLASVGSEAHCTVGRSVTCDVVLDDPFVATVHARITVDASGAVTVTDLGSVNGLEVAGRRLFGQEPVRLPDGVFRIGRTQLRVRTARDVIAPELVDPQAGVPAWLSRGIEQRVVAIGLAVSVAAIVFDVWTTVTRPRELSTSVVTVLLGALAIAGLWVVLWALASRVAFGESRWLRHATILVVVYASLELVGRAVQLVDGALGLHLPSAIVRAVLVAIGVSVALAGHLRNASPMRARTALAIGVVIPAIAVAAFLWLQLRSQERSPSYIADNDVMVPPALVLRRGTSFDGFIAELAELRARADAKRAFVEREDPSPGDDDAD